MQLKNKKLESFFIIIKEDMVIAGSHWPCATKDTLLTIRQYEN